MRAHALPGAAVVALAALAAPPRLPAQVWVGPDSTCGIAPGHFRVNSAVVNLKAAAEKPAQRDRMLAQTVDVLTRALTNDGQAENPAAWYYLGRYYVEVKDPVGADSAFAHAERLAPRCAGDITSWRRSLWAEVLNAGLRNWQEGRQDSAVMLLHRAHRILPAHPKSLFDLGQLYAAAGRVDSAAKYLEQAIGVAADDTAFARARRDAMISIARLRFRAAQETPAVAQWHRTRQARDSAHRRLKEDSTVLARVVESSASRRSRGTRLAPGDQQRFAQDSATRGQAVEQGRAGLRALGQRAPAESSAAAAVLEPAIAAFREYLRANPEMVDAVPALATLYAQSGRTDAATAVFDSLYGAASRVDGEVVVLAGQRILAAGLAEAGMRVLTGGLDRAPYHRDALMQLANARYQARDTGAVLPVAQRLLDVDPLNRTALRLMAAAWDLRGNRDSTAKYLRMADSTLAVEISVASFAADTSGATVAGTATNRRATPSLPLRLTFELLDSRGAVKATQTVEVPTLAPHGTHTFELRAPGAGLRAWRYRPS